MKPLPNQKYFNKIAKMCIFYMLFWGLMLGQGCGSSAEKTQQTNQTKEKDSIKLAQEKKERTMVNAPEINTEHGWLNTDTSYTIKDFRGKIVLLDFWTFGCINCHHILPDLKKLEREYRKELVVIGVHSAKFTTEKGLNNIRKAILKFGIEHPVVNDADYKIWDSYAIKAWPTVVLINPDGKIVFQRSGEGIYQLLKEQIERVVKEFDNKINLNPIAFQLEKNKEKREILYFPSKLIFDKEGNLFIADSGNNRILKINQKGKILQIIGNGKEGLKDGYFNQTTFNEPHGLALKDNLLYIADTKNSAIRVANLQTQTVKTLSGNGKLGYYHFEDKWGVNVIPNSPWDLWIEGDEMFIANAGNHQILRMDLKTNQVYRFAGTGREALTDGELRQAAFNQPSGLTKKGDTLYVADTEASAIRSIDLKKKKVQTVFGKGLFDFGDKDGSLDEALLQHCLGIEIMDNKIYITDTYNGKIKVLDLKQQRLTTLVAGFDEPNDIAFWGTDLWVSDTNNHQIIKINLFTNEKQVIPILP